LRLTVIFLGFEFLVIVTHPSSLLFEPALFLSGLIRIMKSMIVLKMKRLQG
jgi:hypothetical protein